MEITLLASILLLLLVMAECRGGGGGRGSSYRPSSSPSWPSAPRPPTYSSSSSSSSSGRWRAPTQTSRPASSGVDYANSRPVPKPDTAHRPYPTSPPSGWQISKPSAPHATPAPAGWKLPNSANHASNPPIAKQTHVGSSGPTVPNSRPTNNNNYGWKTPTQTAQTQRPPSFHGAVNQVRNQPSANRPNPYNTGRKYEKGYSKGYDQGYQRGVQQATRVNPAYYPQQSHFGYPGQGMTAGYNSPTYGGMSVFGTPNNYGYPVSSAYGYQTYGTGNHDFRNGLLLGVAGGYLLNSALHPSRHYSFLGSSHFGGSRPWGYDGGGYGSGYEYTRPSTVDNHSVVNNYYFSSTPERHKETTEAGGNDMPEHWMQCVAYDPMAAATYTNPNCSCTVTVVKDETTNATVAKYSCDTIWGRKVEQQTPVDESEVFDLNLPRNNTVPPEKLQEISAAMRRMEAYEQIEKLVNMGSFSGLQL